MKSHPRARGALAGLAAAFVGVGAGHLVAALTRPVASPVLAVGTTVINLTPTPVKEWAVRELGTNDKPVLVGSVFAGTLVLAALGGILAAYRFILGAVVLVVLVAASAAAALSTPTAGPLNALPSVVTAAVALAVLALLVRPRAPELPGRRRFLVSVAAVTAAGAVAAAAGQWLIARARDISDVVLPRPAQPIAPLPEGLEYKDLSAFRTPTKDFYRVDVNLVVPQVDPDDWSLHIDGDVRRTLRFSFDELLALPMIERDITMTCVSNEVGGGYVGATRWLGVPVRDLLDRAGVGTHCDQILSTAVDGFTISTPLAVARDGRDMMVAVGMDGEPLPRKHGFPARLITPGLYGYVGGTKWLTRLTLTTYAKHRAYWTRRGWATQGPIKIASRIDTPNSLGTISAGPTVIAGVAWAQHQGVAKVELQIDDADWVQVKLGPDAGIDYWRQWYFPWTATRGTHTVAVRATTRDGAVQTSRRASPFPNGSSGLQQLVVRVD